MNLKPDFALWAKMPEWERNEAAPLLCGIDPRDASRTWSLYSSARWRLPPDQQAKYDGLRELASRARVDGAYKRSYPPAQWLAWAKRYDLPIPAELEAEIIKWADASGSAESAERGRIIEFETRVAELAANVEGGLETEGMDLAAPAPTEANPKAAAKGEKPTSKQAEIIRIAKELWPEGDYPIHVGNRNNKIRETYKEKELTPPGDTNIWTAFKFLKGT